MDEETCGEVVESLSSEVTMAIVIPVDDECSPTAVVCRMLDGTIPLDGSVPFC